MATTCFCCYRRQGNSGRRKTRDQEGRERKKEKMTTQPSLIPAVQESARLRLVHYVMIPCWDSVPNIALIIAPPNCTHLLISAWLTILWLELNIHISVILRFFLSIYGMRVMADDMMGEWAEEPYMTE